jgi:hypothetical protein
MTIRPASLLTSAVLALVLAAQAGTGASSARAARLVRGHGCVSQGLAEFSMILSDIRSQPGYLPYAWFWDRYKNDARFAAWIDARAAREAGEKNVQRVRAWLWEYDKLSPQELAKIHTQSIVVDLLHPCAGNACGTTVLIQDTDGIASSTEIQLNAYQHAVLHLREGDTIRAGDLNIRLGKFLGAGDGSHIWEIAGHPGQVIKLPFVVPAVMTSGPKLKTFVTLEEIRSYFAQLRTPPDIPGLKMLEFKVGPKFAYAITRRVRSPFNGKVFKESHASIIRDIEGQRRRSGRADVAKLAHDHSITEAQARTLLDQHDKLKEAEYRIQQARLGRGAKARTTDVRPSQLAWDEDENDWVLIDW